MKLYKMALSTLTLATVLLGACVAPPPASPVAPAGEWRTYTNADAGFSIETPPTWSQETLPDQYDGNIHGMASTGLEGGVEVYWGFGFGGACPSGTVPVQLAQGEVPACYTKNSDGTETWSQIGYIVDGGNSFSVNAYTSNAQPTSHDVVLKVLSTLTFMLPAAPVVQPTAAGLTNPASENCIEQGGTLEIQTRGDGGQYGVCYFEDNRQCEEWALLRGDCPVGGLKVTGYITPAAQYCAITGGTYTITGNSGQDDEQGTCTFTNGASCDVWAFYNGSCDSSAGATAPAEGATLEPLSPVECNELAQAMGETLGVQVLQDDVPITDPSTGASGTACETKATGTGEQFSSPDAVVNELAGMLEAQGWQEDPMLASGGPTGFGEGFRKDGQMCMAVAQWWPDESANCPKDQPVSACEVTPAQQAYTVTLDCAQSITEATATPTAPAPPQGWQTYANPLGFSISYPATWTAQQLPAQADNTLFTEALQGSEGEVELQWGMGFGGACPEGYTTVQVAQGELSTCYTKNADGTESWTQINKELTLTGFSANARTNNAEPASHDLVLQVLSTLIFPPIAPITATQVITYTPGPPTGAPQEGNCWTNSLAVWRADAWRCSVGNSIYDPCFSQDDSVICGANPVTPTVSFALTLTEPLPAPEVAADTSGHAWIVELADGTTCEFATGATGGVGDERINYLCPSPDPDQQVVILGDLEPGAVWMAPYAVLTGGMPDLTVVESVQVPIRIVWR